VSTEKVHRSHRTSRDKLSLVSTEKINRIHGISRDKLVWCLQRRFIGYTRLVVINWSGVYREDS
jgi:hypothetical protein